MGKSNLLNRTASGALADDNWLNRDELIYTQTFLRGQIVIRELTAPENAVELRSAEKAVSYLLTHFICIATQTDTQGNPAISADDIDWLFSKHREKQRPDRLTFR